MRRVGYVLALLGLLMNQAIAQSPAWNPVSAPRYPSPNMYRPNVDGMAVQGSMGLKCITGANCDLSLFTVTPDTNQAANTLAKLFATTSASNAQISGISTLLNSVNTQVGANSTAITTLQSLTGTHTSQIASIQAALPGKAATGANTDITSLASPALGSPTMVTQSLNDNTTKGATTAYADRAAATAAAGVTPQLPLSAIDEYLIAIRAAGASGSYLPLATGIADGYSDNSGIDPTSTNATIQSGTVVNQANDVNLKSLLHFDGTSGSNTITDAVAGHTWTASGAAALSSTQSVFGGSSLYLPSAGAYITATASPDYGIGSGDFAYNLRLFPTQISGGWLIDTRTATGTNPGFSAYLNASGKVVLYSTGNIILTSTATLAVNTWVDIEIDRSSSTLRLFINGNFDSSVTDNTTYPTSQPIRIGNAISADATQIGYFDEFRFRNAYAHNTSTNFTPASAAFTIGTSGVLNLLSNNYTLPAVPTKGTLVFLGTATANGPLAANSNIIGSISRDAGTTYLDTTMTTMNLPNGQTVFMAKDVDLTTLPVGSSLKTKIRTTGSLGVAIDGSLARAY